MLIPIKERRMAVMHKRCVMLPDDLEKFISEQNIKLYRKLLAASADEAQRRRILRLLADQMADLRNS